MSGKVDKNIRQECVKKWSGERQRAINKEYDISQDIAGIQASKQNVFTARKLQSSAKRMVSIQVVFLCCLLIHYKADRSFVEEGHSLGCHCQPCK